MDFAEYQRVAQRRAAAGDEHPVLDRLRIALDAEPLRDRLCCCTGLRKRGAAVQLDPAQRQPVGVVTHDPAHLEDALG